MAEDHDHEDGYAGPATLTVDGRDVPVEALLDARHEPHDGKMHWFGRVTPASGLAADLAAALKASSATVELSTDGGRAPAQVGDLDPWGRYRVTGVGPPPFVLDDPVLDDN
ncbi:DUF4873 domain-containing protein [Pseudonocardia sp. TRM90224]|uniref:DUF4873 domain-containing protein n=1 Tax=Pseudonocardia sp. TRM90224 TaxID=2812678 RepID=UPI001E2C29E8|nr:DUF4873 domain-containing protein [Pseudonocardia sp. TRM90224]